MARFIAQGQNNKRVLDVSCSFPPFSCHGKSIHVLLKGKRLGVICSLEMQPGPVPAPRWESQAGAVSVALLLFFFVIIRLQMGLEVLGVEGSARSYMQECPPAQRGGLCRPGGLDGGRQGVLLSPLVALGVFPK